MRFGVMRPLTDYQVLLAPINSLLYFFSKTKARAFIAVADFPEMKPLQGHWQIMRDEALALNADGAIAVATGYNDIGFNSFFRRHRQKSSKQNNAMFTISASGY